MTGNGLLHKSDTDPCKTTFLSGGDFLFPCLKYAAVLFHI